MANKHMGDRISIQFKNNCFGCNVHGKDKSVVLFSHWGGLNFLKEAEHYVRELKTKLKKRSISYPIDRLEPSTVMVDFIRYYTKDEDLIEGNLYLGRNENDGDNSDNGHCIIDLNDKQFETEIPPMQGSKNVYRVEYKKGKKPKTNSIK